MFVQTYNPMCIAVSETRKVPKQTVYRFYTSTNDMRVNDRVAYLAASRRVNSL